MSPATAVRSAGTADLGALETLVNIVLDLYISATPGQFRRPDTPDVHAFLQGLLLDQANLVLVAEVEGAVRGYLWCRLEARTDGLFTAARTDVHLHHVAVDPSTRRQGLARALVTESLAWARAQGADGVQLQVWSFNTSAADFFTACGFVSQAQLMHQPLT